MIELGEYYSLNYALAAHNGIIYPFETVVRVIGKAVTLPDNDERLFIEFPDGYSDKWRFDDGDLIPYTGEE